MILNTKHLAVIRAALEYWDNEMSPHAPIVYTAYFDEPIGDGGWVSDAVTALRARLPTCRLRYVHCSPDASTLLSNRLFQTLDEFQHSVAQESALIATVLIDKPVSGFANG